MISPQDKKAMMLRTYLVYVILCVFGLVVMIKVFRIQVDTQNVIGKNVSVITDMKTIEAVRGNIYSDNGSLLATSIPMYEVRMDMAADGLSTDEFYSNVDSLAWCLANLFRDKTKAQYLSKLNEAKKSNNRYFLIHNRVRYQELKEMKNFPLFRKGKNKGGFIVIKQNKRSRPFGLLAARLIGYERVDPENTEYVSRVGLEGAFTDELSGTNGKQLMKKIGGRWRPVKDQYEVNPVDGADLITSININIQDVAEHALETQLQKYEATSGCVVLMEVQTGMVKAMANLSLGEDGNYYEFMNYAIGYSIEPGSTFKLPSLMVGLEDGKFKPSDSVKTGNGSFNYYNLKMTDTRPHGTVTIQHAFEISSNIGCSRPIYDAYAKSPKAYVDGLKKMGIGELLGLDIKGEATPYIKDPSDRQHWSGVTLPQMAIGYEEKLAPIHILTFYNAVANNGKMVKPQFVQEIKRNGKTVKKFEPVVLKEKICSDKTLNYVRPMLEGVVENGTAQNLKAANFKIAGKTGTAQIYDKGSYGKQKYLASFVGYFPADKPKYSCIVWVMEPNVTTGYYGNAVAGTVFKEIADKIYSRTLEIHQRKMSDLLATKELPQTKKGMQHDIQFLCEQLGIKAESNDPVAEWVIPQTEDNKKLALKKEKIEDNKVPDVTGMGLKDALYLLENRGLKVRVVGSGKVKRQSLPEGTVCDKGQMIMIELM